MMYTLDQLGTKKLKDLPTDVLFYAKCPNNVRIPFKLYTEDTNSNSIFILQNQSQGSIPDDTEKWQKEKGALRFSWVCGKNDPAFMSIINALGSYEMLSISGNAKDDPVPSIIKDICPIK